MQKDYSDKGAIYSLKFSIDHEISTVPGNSLKELETLMSISVNVLGLVSLRIDMAV